MLLTTFFVFREVSLWILPLRDTLKVEQIFYLLCVPEAIQITVSMLYSPRSFSCLPTNSNTVPSQLCHSQNLWLLKVKVLSPVYCKNLRNLAPLIFQANGFGRMFSLCVPLCAPLSLTLLCDHSSLPFAVALSHISPKPHLHASYLLQCGLLYLFSCRVCSLSLQIGFWVI